MTMKRFLMTALAGLTLSIGATRPAAAQVDDVLDRLAESALGFARGCDYSEYLSTAQDIAKGWDVISNLANWRPSTGTTVVPVTDIFSNLLQAGAREAAMESTKKQAEGLIYQLEQTCQMVMQVDETNRIHRIYQAGHFNVGNSLDWLASSVSVPDSVTLGTDEPNLGIDFATRYEAVTPQNDFPNDTIFKAVSQTMYSTLEAADGLLRSLDQIHEEIMTLKDELRLRAVPGENTAWICPEGYPGESGFDSASALGLETDDSGRPICGPVPPARAQQIMAAAEVMKVQLMAIAQSAEARNLETQAVALMADNQERRQDNHSDKRVLAY